LSLIGCIRVPVTKILRKMSVAVTRTLSRGDEMLTFSREILSHGFGRRSRPKMKDAFLIALFGRALVQLSKFRDRNPI